jgi:hypothetical protein
MWILALPIVFFVLAMCAAGIFFTSRGKSWARMFILAFVIFTTVIGLLPSEDETPHELIETILDYMRLALEFAAIYLLFSRPGALRFRTREQNSF